MFYPSQKRELLRGICYFISDSATYRCFALASVYCSRLAKEYAPMKKAEFVRHAVLSLLPPMRHTCLSVLPNKRFHGHFKSYSLDGICLSEAMYLNGKRMWRWDIELNRMKKWDATHVYSLWGKVVIAVGTETIVFIRSVKTSVTSFKCPVCYRFHLFCVYRAGPIGWTCLSLWKSCIASR